MRKGESNLVTATWSRGDAYLVDSTAVGAKWKGRLGTNCCYSKDARFGVADVIENICRP